MFFAKLLPIIKGYGKELIIMLGARDVPKTGGTDEAAYCYSVWLRHLVLLNKDQALIPETVLEVGPGDSLGIGIAALLSGVRTYLACDIIQYWNAEDNLKILEEILCLFKERAPLADNERYPALTPHLNNYNFPTRVLTEELLVFSLDPDRIEKIRFELATPSTSNKFVRYYAPWTESDVARESVDFIFSQSVLQYTNLTKLYTCINSWLKVHGHSAHVVDFSSLGITKIWNGHWAFSKTEWGLYSFKKKMLLNRQPLSSHVELHRHYHLKILEIQKYTKPNRLIPKHVAREFRSLTNQDLETHAAYILSTKMK